MAQGRMLRKDICESDSFAGLNDPKAQLLCCLLTPWWDDHGKMIGDEGWIKGNIVRKLKTFTEKEISRCLKLINDHLDVQWWIDERGNKWLYWPKFDNHQTLSEAKKTKDNLPSPKIPKNPQKTSSTREVEVKRSRREVEVEDILSDLNLVLNSSYKSSSLKTRDLIQARLNEGHTIEDFKTVHRKMVKAWGIDNKMRPYLRPLTLYSNKFESYLNRPEDIRQLTTQQQNNLKQLEELRKENKNDKSIV
jgi:uncharacterized phage protein (TIGR02220 family)